MTTAKGEIDQTKIRETLKDDYGEGWRVLRRGSTIAVELLYPPYDTDPDKGRPRFMTVGIEHTRAVDDLRIWFSLDRNGWVVEQAQVFEWAGDDPVCDPQWKEVAFIEAWVSQKVPDPQSDR